MNRVLAFTVRQIMSPCRVYSEDFLAAGVDVTGIKHRLSPSAQAQAQAKLAGKRTYLSTTPCRKCGGLERGTHNGNCAACTRLRARARRAAAREQGDGS